MAKKIFGFKYPSSDKIASRTSTVARSMASTLVPIIEVDEQTDNDKNLLINMAALLYYGEYFDIDKLNNKSDLFECLEGQKKDDIVNSSKNLVGLTEQDDNKGSEIKCVYCGEKATHLDHLFPLVIDKLPSGFCSEPTNLVPCCGNCNQSKGAKMWYEYMDITNYIRIENLKKRIRYYTNFDRYTDCEFTKNLYNEWNDKTNDFKKNKNAFMDNFVDTLFNAKDKTEQQKQMRDALSKNDDSHNLLMFYLEHLDKDSNDSQERILFRLINNRDENSKILGGLNCRKQRLHCYCKYFKMPSCENEKDTKDHILNYFGTVIDKDKDEVKEWWGGIYDNIKNSLDSAQIQIDAFNAGIKMSVDKDKKNKINKFEYYFKARVYEEEGKANNRIKEYGIATENPDKPQLFKKLFEYEQNNGSRKERLRLLEIGFYLSDDGNAVKHADKTAENIYNGAQTAFELGCRVADSGNQGILSNFYGICQLSSDDGDDIDEYE